MRLWRNGERALHYAEQAAKLREIAETETSETVRKNLLQLADQCTRLRDGLLAEQTGESTP